MRQGEAGVREEGYEARVYYGERVRQVDEVGEVDEGWKRGM